VIVDPQLPKQSCTIPIRTKLEGKLTLMMVAPGWIL